MTDSFRQIIFSRTAALSIVIALFAGSAWSTSCVPVAGSVAPPPTPVVVPPGGTALNPTDITAYLLGDQYVQLQGGQYIVRVPPALPNGFSISHLTAQLQAKNDSNARFSAAFLLLSTPVLDYKGVISGSGTIRITNQTKAIARSDLQVDGGALAFHCTQTWKNADRSPVMVIDPNTSVQLVESYTYKKDEKTQTYAYVQGSAFEYPEANFVNNGMLHSHVGYEFGDITGVGSAGFGHDYIWREDSLTSGHTYSGHVFIGYGVHVRTNTKLDPKLQLWQQGIWSFETQAGSLINGRPKPHIDTFAGSYWNAGPDTQIQRWGVQQFTGESFLMAGVPGPTLLSSDDARKLGCLYGPGFGIQKGRTFYNIGTMMLGDGSPIVNYPDGTTNFFMQGHPYNQNSWIIFGQFDNQPKSIADLAGKQALALNYSGKYSVNIGINTEMDGVNLTGEHDKAWGNLIVMNPDPEKKGNAPNHAVLTQPVMLQGIVQIEPNAILQLGDGTTGNEFTKEVTVTTVDGPKLFKNTCNMSGGNGMLITKGNRPTIQRLAASDYFQISNEGKLVVNNTPNALSITRVAFVELSNWMTRNTLDGIVGSGSVEQAGTLPLTLGSSTGNANTYTGGTLVKAGATLLIGSATALGARNPAVAGSGKLQNDGVLRARAGVRTIFVPGDYVQANSN